MLTTDDLVQGDNCFFAATGITDGPLLDGVRFDAARRVAHRAWSCARAAAPSARIDARHRLDKLRTFAEIDYT